MIRVIIAEDHHLVREGIRALLEKSGEVQVIGEAATGEEAINLTLELQPDVVIMDLSMPRLDGVQASSRIINEDIHTKIIIVSMHADSAMIKQLLQNGVKGYLLKDAVASELLLAVKSAHNGRVYLSPTISESVMTLLLAPEEDDSTQTVDRLTPREREVLQLVAEGHTNNSIADLLSISVKTVEKHRANVMSKLEVSDVASLVREAIRQGFILLD